MLLNIKKINLLNILKAKNFTNLIENALLFVFINFFLNIFKIAKCRLGIKF